MGLEQDLRDFLVAANTAAGPRVYFTTTPQNEGSPFININLESADAQHTTQAGPGHLTEGMIDVVCSVKTAANEYQQYLQAVSLADAVKTQINSVTTWPYLMGNTLVYYMAIESIPERAKSRGTHSMPYQYQEGKGSGIQRKVVPLAIQYWDPNS